MFTHTILWYAPVISDGETYIYEDKRTGLVFTTVGSLPDSDEIEHVEDYHAGSYCPVWIRPGLCACCCIGNNTPCHDAGLAGNW